MCTLPRHKINTLQHLHGVVSQLEAHLEQSGNLSTLLALVEQLTYRLGQLAPGQAEEAHPPALESDTDTLTGKQQLISKTLGKVLEWCLVIVLLFGGSGGLACQGEKMRKCLPLSDP